MKRTWMALVGFCLATSACSASSERQSEAVEVGESHFEIGREGADYVFYVKTPTNRELGRVHFSPVAAIVSVAGVEDVHYPLPRPIMDEATVMSLGKLLTVGIGTRKLPMVESKIVAGPLNEQCADLWESSGQLYCQTPSNPTGQHAGCDQPVGDLSCTNVGSCCDAHDQCITNNCLGRCGDVLYAGLHPLECGAACVGCQLAVVACMAGGLPFGPQPTGPSTCCAKGTCGGSQVCMHNGVVITDPCECVSLGLTAGGFSPTQLEKMCGNKVAPVSTPVLPAAE